VLEDLARKYGFEQKLASVRKIAASPLDFASKKDGLIEALLTVGRRAIEEDGADTLIGYGGIECIGRLRAELGVPIISPVQVPVLMEETLVRQNLSQSKVAHPTPSDLERIKTLQLKYE